MSHSNARTSNLKCRLIPTLLVGVDNTHFAVSSAFVPVFWFRSIKKQRTRFVEAAFRRLYYRRLNALDQSRYGAW